MTNCDRNFVGGQVGYISQNTLTHVLKFQVLLHVYEAVQPSTELSTTQLFLSLPPPYGMGKDLEGEKKKKIRGKKCGLR